MPPVWRFDVTEGMKLLSETSFSSSHTYQPCPCPCEVQVPGDALSFRLATLMGFSSFSPKKVSTHITTSVSFVCVQCLPCHASNSLLSSCPKAARFCWEMSQNQTQYNTEPGCLSESPGLLGNPFDPPISPIHPPDLQVKVMGFGARES